jgi:hypothetical protein
LGGYPGSLKWHDPRLVEVVELLKVRAEMNPESFEDEWELTSIRNCTVTELRGSRYGCFNNGTGGTWIFDPEALDEIEWEVIE